MGGKNTMPLTSWKGVVESIVSSDSVAIFRLRMYLKQKICSVERVSAKRYQKV